MKSTLERESIVCETIRRESNEAGSAGRLMSALCLRDPTRDQSLVGPLVALSCTPAWISQWQFLVCLVHHGAVGRVLWESVLAPEVRHDGD